MKLGRVAGVTDPGRRRRRNEDAYVCEPPLFAVADGMGGARAGQVASRLAAAALRELALPQLPAEERVSQLIQEANRRVYERSSEDTSVSGMGTTMTVAVVDDSGVTIGHVGDSRAYLIRDGRLDQVTEDHSLVAELLRDGKLSPEEAETHPQRSVITRVLGTDPDVDVDTFSIEAQNGDVFLLATDGLTSMVSDEQILSIVEHNRDNLEAAARALVRAANRGGGEDNITVVAFEIAGDTSEQTATQTVPQVEVDEEKTLSELDRVPVVGAGERPSRKRHARARRILYALSALALVAAVCLLALWGLLRAHFVGAEPNGQVAVYQGVPFDLFGPVRLYRARYVSPLRAAQLTRQERRRLFDHDLRTYDSALSAVHQYEREVVR